MADITAALVKELRELTGVGMMDCKKALSENSGDLNDSVDWLRSQGLSSAAKKSGRAASEGLVAVTVVDNKGAIIELNSETDFVARNEVFQSVAENICGIAIENNGDLDAIKHSDYPGGGSVTDQLTHLIATIGENMNLRRSDVLEVKTGIICSYVHNAVNTNLGKIGVLVALESNGNAQQLEILGKQISMHVAAANPMALSRNDISQVDLNREKTILSEQAKDSGKPPEIIDKMVEGRLSKYYSEVCLLEQKFVIDPDITVEKAISEFSKEAGIEIVLKDFIRFGLGDGIEKEEQDFAAEVAAVANKN
ncbi:MAG: translation elongation factor Ts [Rhodospirillales bacterium]|tara:strand:- start:2822 stop:3748 length:927 start_codon:yes stop_codon:yes gene_type:complete